MNRQIRLVAAGLILLFVALFINLNYLQVVHAKALDDNPLNSTRVVNEFDQPRGAILSADGVTLADSVPTPKGSSFKYLRRYPTGSLFGGVTGYYSFIYGSAGAEDTYNDILTGTTSKSGFPTSLSGLRQLLTERSAAQSITLTLSAKLQEVARTGLARRVGSVVALNPSTGAILAMYSDPSYDPEALSQLSTTKEQAAWKRLNAAPGNPLLVGAYRDRWPPGSSFKTITASAVYDRQPALASQDVPYLAALPLPQTTTELHNFAGEVCGGQLLQLFTVSCDTGFGKIGLELGAQKLYDEATAYGFDASPPIDLPNPVVSNFPKPATFRQNLPTLAYSAIGQENVAASPLEMAMVAGAVADHGTIMVPHVLSYITNSQGAVVSRYQDRVWKHATSASTARKMTALMESVVNSPGGTAPTAAIAGVEVAGKTGTAETGTVPPRTDDWFIAFAPAAHPTIAVAVVLPDQGAANEFQGGTLAAPIAKAVIQAWLAAHPVKGAGQVVTADTGGKASPGSRSSVASPTTLPATPTSTTAAPTTTTPITTAPATTAPATTTTTPAPPATTAPGPPPTTAGSPAPSSGSSG